MLGARLRHVRRIVLALAVAITAAVVALSLNDEQASATASSTLVVNEVVRPRQLRSPLPPRWPARANESATARPHRC